MERKLLIVAITKAGPLQTCVGGIDIESFDSVRLRTSVESPFVLPDYFQYSIGDVLMIDQKVDAKVALNAPHVEDILIDQESAYRIDQVASIANWVRQNRHRLRYSVGDIKSLFDGHLKNEAGASGLYPFFLEGSDLPNYSTCFWNVDTTLYPRLEYEETHFDLEPAGHAGTIPYVGVAKTGSTAIIKLGSLLRMSLARWWRPDGSAKPKRCHLQISGILE